jgi:hypothetical protein
MSARSCYARLVAALACALCATTAAHAVTRNPTGEGQVLLFPYYTTAAGNVTLLSLVNGTDDAKVLSLRFANGRIGTTAAQLNLYLGPNDSWSATVFPRGIDSPGIVAGDASCTFPDLVQNASLPRLPDGRPYLSFAPEWPDRDAESSTEGFIEVVDIATIKPDTPTFQATHWPGVQRRCAGIVEAWQSPDGAWAREPLRDLANPTGGISGAASVVNVAKGILFTTMPVALDEFRTDPADIPRGTRSTVALHPKPGVNAPSLLDKALSDPVGGIASATVSIAGRRIVATYPAATQGIDAVAAALSAAELRGEYDTTPALGATTSFVLTHPLRHFYAAPELAEPVLPYRYPIGYDVPLRSSEGIGFRAYDRDQNLVSRSPPPEGCGWLCPAMPSVRTPGTVIEVLATNGQPDPLLATHYHSDIGPSYSDAPQPVTGSGVLILEPGQLWPYEPRNHTLRASREGYRFVGLPLIGTQLNNYVNAQAAPGLLANYAAVRAMAVRQRCIMADGAECRP